MGKGYTYMWQFRVCPESQARFLTYYSANGIWVQLFRRSPGYKETLLLKDLSAPDRYLTIDRWQSEEDHANFRRNFAGEYAQLDSECNALIADEQFLGSFSE